MVMHILGRLYRYMGVLAGFNTVGVLDMVGMAVFFLYNTDSFLSNVAYTTCFQKMGIWGERKLKHGLFLRHNSDMK